MEIVDDVEDAVSHIHANGSSHTDAIITENGKGSSIIGQLSDPNGPMEHSRKMLFFL